MLHDSCSNKASIIAQKKRYQKQQRPCVQMPFAVSFIDMCGCVISKTCLYIYTSLHLASGHLLHGVVYYNVFGIAQTHSYQQPVAHGFFSGCHKQLAGRLSRSSCVGVSVADSLGGPFHQESLELNFTGFFKKISG